MDESTIHGPSSVAHFDVCGPDLEGLAGFYGGLFGWAVARRGPGYASLETAGWGPNGAIVEAERASLTLGVVVADLPEALRRAVELGGCIVMPETDNGWVRKAQVSDPAGNLVTLIAS